MVSAFSFQPWRHTTRRLRPPSPSSSTGRWGSDAEMVAHDLIRQLVDGSAGDAPAFFEKTEFARHAARETELLLDEEHGHAHFPIQLENNVADLVHEIRLNALGRLVQNKEGRL